MQYACVAAGWSAHTQALDVDVKHADSVAELMRLAAPCPPQPHAYPCAAGINTSSVLVFAESAMLDSEVAQASAGAVRALPLGLFAALVSGDAFARSVGGTRGEGADESSATDHSAAYHLHNQNLFTDPDLRLVPLPWPTALASSAQHAAWLAQAAVDAWLGIVPFPYILHAHAVVNARSSASFSPNASDAIGANGRQCTLASIHLDHAQYHLKTQQHDKFVEGAWFCIDLSSVCLFSALNLRLKHPARDRIAASFNDIYWKLHQLDRVQLPPMAGCDECARCRSSACHVTHALRSYAASDGKRLADLYGHLPGYWLHPGLVIATFEKNVTKWSGARAGRAAGARCGSDAGRRAAHGPARQGPRHQDDKEAESRWLLLHVPLPSNRAATHRSRCRQNNRPNPQGRRPVLAGAAAAIRSVARPQVHARAGARCPPALPPAQLKPPPPACRGRNST